MEGIDLKNRELVTVKKRRFALVMGGVLNQPPFVIDLDRNSIDYAHVGVSAHKSADLADPDTFGTVILTIMIIGNDYSSTMGAHSMLFNFAIISNNKYWLDDCRQR